MPSVVFCPHGRKDNASQRLDLSDILFREVVALTCSRVRYVASDHCKSGGEPQFFS